MISDPYPRGLTLADLPPEETLAEVVEQIGQAESPLKPRDANFRTAHHHGADKGDGCVRWLVTWRGPSGVTSRQARAKNESEAHAKVAKMPNAGTVPAFEECTVMVWANRAACPRVRARREAVAEECAPTERAPARLIPPTRAERRGLRE